MEKNKPQSQTLNIEAPAKDTAPAEPPKKKAYTTPKLEVYGSLPNLTRTVGNKGASDGGGGGTQKTHT